MLKCNQVSHLVSTGEVAELGFMKKMELRMHLFMCGHCRRYVAQIQALGRVARDMARRGDAQPDQLEHMEKTIKSRVARGEK